MNICVANTAKFNIDLYILCPCGSAGDLVWLQGCVSGVRGVARNEGHGQLLKLHEGLGKHGIKSCRLHSNSASLASLYTQRISDLVKSYQETGFVIIMATR
jgi:hypothetical protein